MPTSHSEDRSNAGPLATVSPSETDLAARFWERLRVFAVRQLGDPAAAQDVAQETLRRVVEALRAARLQDPAALPGFVFSTARHICSQHRRALGREARALERLDAGGGSGGHVDALTSLISEERQHAVQRALDQLGETDRELLRLLYYEQVDIEQLARRLSLTPGALRVRKHRALRRLGELLGGRAGNDSTGSAT